MAAVHGTQSDTNRVSHGRVVCVALCGLLALVNAVRVVIVAGNLPYLALLSAIIAVAGHRVCVAARTYRRRDLVDVHRRPRHHLAGRVPVHDRLRSARNQRQPGNVRSRGQCRDQHDARDRDGRDHGPAELTDRDAFERGGAHPALGELAQERNRRTEDRARPCTPGSTIRGSSAPASRAATTAKTVPAATAVRSTTPYTKTVERAVAAAPHLDPGCTPFAVVAEAAPQATPTGRLTELHADARHRLERIDEERGTTGHHPAVAPADRLGEPDEAVALRVLLAPAALVPAVDEHPAFVTSSADARGPGPTGAGHTDLVDLFEHASPRVAPRRRPARARVRTRSRS